MSDAYVIRKIALGHMYGKQWYPFKPGEVPFRGFYTLAGAKSAVGHRCRSSWGGPPRHDPSEFEILGVHTSPQLTGEVIQP